MTQVRAVRRSEAGLSFLEIVIVMAILAGLMVALLQYLMVTNRTYEQEMYRRHTQFELQQAIDRVWTDIKESNINLSRLTTYVDANFPPIANCPTTGQPLGVNPTVMLLVSNRVTVATGPVPLDYTKYDPFAGIPSRGALPTWSKLVIYAPHFTGAAGNPLYEGTLMRYEVDRNQANAELEKYFTNSSPQWPPVITAANITLASGSIVIPRATIGGTFRGERMVRENLFQFNVIANTNPVFWTVNLEAHRHGITQDPTIGAVQLAAYRAAGSPGRVGIFTGGRPRNNN